MLQERLIQHGNLTAGGTVYEYRVEDIHLHDLVTHVLRVGREACTQGLLVVVEVDTVAIQHEVVHIRDTHHVQLQSARLHQELLLGADLLKQHAAHGTDTTDEEVQHLVFRQEERVVQHVERLAQELAVDHERDIRLRSTLSTGNHADTGASQCAEQLTGDTRGLLHVLTHDGDCG